MMNRINWIPLVVAICWVWASAAGAQEINAVQAAICQDVVDREPVRAGDRIPAGTARVFCFTWIQGAREETAVIHNWYHNGVLKASVTLPVRSSSWRTWSAKTLLPEWTGPWMVEVLSRDGTPLENLVFTVE